MFQIEGHWRKRHGKYEQCTILGWIFCYKRHYWVSCKTSMGSLNKGHMGVLCTPYDFFMRLKLFPCTKEKRKKKFIHDYTVHAANIETIVFCFLFLALTPAIYQSMIWKYVCLWSYGRIRKIETDPCSKTNGPWSFTS